MEKINQSFFVLTRDMVPIEFIGSSGEEVGFFCPLPKGFRQAARARTKEIKSAALAFKAEINWDAERMKTPFENILWGHNGGHKEDILKTFRITDIDTNRKRGVHRIQVGEIDSTNICLLSDRIDWYERLTLFPFRELFDPEIGFRCSSAYWQALIARELCVRYFNFLRSLLPRK